MVVINMSKLVKTGEGIAEEINDANSGLYTSDKAKRVLSSYYLILPEGLDKLEEMLKEINLEEEYIVLSVLARFKKENGL